MERNAHGEAVGSDSMEPLSPAPAAPAPAGERGGSFAAPRPALERAGSFVGGSFTRKQQAQAFADTIDPATGFQGLLRSLGGGAALKHLREMTQLTEGLKDLLEEQEKQAFDADHAKVTPRYPQPRQCK